MKIFNFKILLSSLLLLLTVSIFISCKKDTIAAPVVTKVRATDASQANNSLTSAIPGNYLVIEGQNLANATKVLFNGYEAYFNTAFNTDTHLVVQIPTNTPTPDADPTVPNTITIVTPNGTVNYKFNINPNPPQIANVYNENVIAGDTMRVTGAYLLGVNEVAFSDGKKVTSLQKSTDGKTLKFAMPAGVGSNVKMSLNSPYGNVSYKFGINNTNGTGVFANFEPWTPEYGWAKWDKWDNAFSSDASLYPKSTGSFIRGNFTNIGANDNGWWSPFRNVAVGNLTKVLYPTTELNNLPDLYYLKFEINTKTPIKAGAKFLIESTDKGADGKKAFSYYYIPYLNEPNNILDTKNTWKTITIPLNNFGYFKWDDSWLSYEIIKMTKVGDFLNPDGTMGWFHIGIVSGDTGIDAFETAFDNIRLVKALQ